MFGEPMPAPALLSDESTPSACRLPRTLDGANLSATAPTPVGCLATAAAAATAGDHATSDRLLTYARQLTSQHPTYYGDALLAIMTSMPALTSAA